MMADYSTPSCPFCPITDQDADFVTQHIDFCHPEFGGAGFLSDSPPVASPRLSPSLDDDADKYVDCPHGCGETVANSELSNHLDLHVQRVWRWMMLGQRRHTQTWELHMKMTIHLTRMTRSTCWILIRGVSVGCSEMSREQIQQSHNGLTTLRRQLALMAQGD